MASGESAGASAGIGGVDGGVGEAIEGHGGGAGGEHGDDDPKKLMGGGKAGGGEHGSAEGEGEGEDGVLPLDHFEGDAEVVEDGHGKIVKQNSCQLPVAGCQLVYGTADWELCFSCISSIDKECRVGHYGVRRLRFFRLRGIGVWIGGKVCPSLSAGFGRRMRGRISPNMQ